MVHQNQKFYKLYEKTAENLCRAGLTAADWRLWAVLSSSNPFGGFSQSDIAIIREKANLSRASFYRALSHLQDLGLIITGESGSIEWKIPIESIEDPSPTTTAPAIVPSVKDPSPTTTAPAIVPSVKDPSPTTTAPAIVPSVKDPSPTITARGMVPSVEDPSPTITARVMVSSVEDPSPTTESPWLTNGEFDQDFVSDLARKWQKSSTKHTNFRDQPLEVVKDNVISHLTKNPRRIASYWNSYQQERIQQERIQQERIQQERIQQEQIKRNEAPGVPMPDHIRKQLAEILNKKRPLASLASAV